MDDFQYGRHPKLQNMVKYAIIVKLGTLCMFEFIENLVVNLKIYIPHVDGFIQLAVISIFTMHMQRLERYYIVQFSKGCVCSRVNQDRIALSKTLTRIFDSIPPSQDALLKHIKRALLQAGYVWRQ